MINRLFNLGLRGGGMVGKFLLIFFLARILPPEEVGIYGLFTATVSYAMYFLGLDFYTYSGRAMLHTEKTMWPAMLRDQAVLFVFSYLLVFPLLGMVFFFELLPIEYALVFYVLLTVEQVSQELNRIMVTIGKPVAAGVFMFIRTGGWCYALVAAYLGKAVIIEIQTVFVLIAEYVGRPIIFDIESVLWLWVMADTLVIIGGFWLLRKLPWGDMTWRINWAWLSKGVRVSALFLLGTLALRGLFTLDRYFVDIFAGKQMLGVYTLFFGICNSLIGFVDAAVFSFRYPALVSLYKPDEHKAFNSAKRDFGHQTFFAVTAMALAAGLLIVPVLEWIGKPIYLQHLPVFYALLATSVAFVLSHIPHYALYAMGNDRNIVGANIVGVITFILYTAVLAPEYEVFGVVFALFMAVAVTGALKQWKVISLTKKSVFESITN